MSEKRTVACNYFACIYCNKSYSHNRNLRQHVKKSHPNDALPPCVSRERPSPLSVDPSFVIHCSICSKAFRSKSTEYKHRKKCHAINPTHTDRKAERGCKEIHHFRSFVEFMQWKTAKEEETTSHYSKHGGDKKCLNGDVRKVYYCHRSGVRLSMGKAARAVKVQGSCKIGSWCPSAMFIRMKPSGAIEVIHFPTHRGHKCEIAHQRISSEKRAEIAGLLTIGIPFKDVLDKVQLDVTGSMLSPLSLVTKKTLHNVMRDFKINKGGVFQKFKPLLPIGSAENQTVGPASTVQAVQLNDEGSAIVQVVRQSSTHLKKVARSKEWLLQTLALMETCDDTSKLDEVAEVLSQCNATVKAILDRTEMPRMPASVSQEPANKQAEIQRRFSSTKRLQLRKRKPEETMSKPTSNEKATILESLSGNATLISQANVVPDHDYKGVNSSSLNIHIIDVSKAY